MSRLFIPEKLHVGFNSRNNTYTKKLAYVIYTDEKGKKRKETSWENWRDKSIPVENYDNVPTEGFVLNKKVGGYKSHWNFRNAYVRVYDPRGFEFEITVENLLFILENTSSIIGKGLEGKFVYSWDGKDLVLLPTNSQNYIESTEYTEQLTTAKKIGAKDMELGKVYLDKQFRRYVFLGRKQGYSFTYSTGKYKPSKGKHFWFLRLKDKGRITEKDIELLKKIYKNRENYETPFELSYSQKKGDIESFSGVSSKFIQMSDTIDTLALAYGELLLKDDIFYNKQEQKFKRRPATLDDLNSFAQGAGVKNGGFNSNRAHFTPFSRELINNLKEKNIKFSSLKANNRHFKAHYTELWDKNSLTFETVYSHSGKDCTVYELDDIFEVLTFSLSHLHRYNVWSHKSELNFEELEFLLNEDNITWVEKDKQTREPLLNKEGKVIIVNKFEKDKDYLGIRTITVKEILGSLEVQELYHKDHLVRKGIVNK